MKENLIDKQVKILSEELRNNPNLKKELEIKFEQFVRKVYTDSFLGNQGYCANLKVPTKDIMKVYDKISGLEESNVKKAFATEWNVPSFAHMYNNPFYHTCLLFVIYGIRENDRKLAENALTLILTLLWNGRRSRWIRYCDPDTLKYVISQLSRRNLFRKYDSPIALVKDYFAPTLLDKYAELIKRDSKTTKRLFDQSFSRLHQLFGRDAAPNLQTGKKEVRRGIAADYYKAKEKGLKISQSKSTAFDEDDGPNPLEQHTTDQYEEIVSRITNYIIMNLRPKYEEWFLDVVQKESKVNRNAINLFLSNIHNIKHDDYLREIVRLIAVRLQINTSNICSRNFIIRSVKDKLISSKNTPDINQMKKIIDLLVADIFKHSVTHINYDNYTAPTRGKFRKVIIYAIAYNIQKYICFNK